MATMSLSTDVSQDTDRRLPGSPRTLSGSRTAAWRSTGTFYKTRQQKLNRKAACQCLAKSFQHKEKSDDKENRSRAIHPDLLQIVRSSSCGSQFRGRSPGHVGILEIN